MTRVLAIAPRSEAPKGVGPAAAGGAGPRVFKTSQVVLLRGLSCEAPPLGPGEGASVRPLCRRLPARGRRPEVCIPKMPAVWETRSLRSRLSVPSVSVALQAGCSFALMRF